MRKIVLSFLLFLHCFAHEEKLFSMKGAQLNITCPVKENETLSLLVNNKVTEVVKDGIRMMKEDRSALENNNLFYRANATANTTFECQFTRSDSIFKKLIILERPFVTGVRNGDRLICNATGFPGLELTALNNTSVIKSNRDMNAENLSITFSAGERPQDVVCKASVSNGTLSSSIAYHDFLFAPEAKFVPEIASTDVNVSEITTLQFSGLPKPDVDCDADMIFRESRVHNSSHFENDYDVAMTGVDDERLTCIVKNEFGSVEVNFQLTRLPQVEIYPGRNLLPELIWWSKSANSLINATVEVNLRRRRGARSTGGPVKKTLLDLTSTELPDGVAVEKTADGKKVAFAELFQSLKPGIQYEVNIRVCNSVGCTTKVTPLNIPIDAKVLTNDDLSPLIPAQLVAMMNGSVSLAQSCFSWFLFYIASCLYFD